jgi:CheY-like chemotaxis protein
VNVTPAQPRTATPTLVVDDDAEQRQLVADLLGVAGIGPIFQAGDAEAAVAIAARQELTLIVLDVVMPGRSGLEVLPELHDLARGASIVVLSNLPRRRLGEVARARGATGYVEKRVPPERLVGEILVAAAAAAVAADRVTAQLPADPIAARAARGLVRQALPAIDQELVSSIELLVSELVTNAVLHASSAARLDVHVTAANIRVEVFDDDATLPELQPPDSLRSSGRGLQLVDAIASRWGSEAQLTGKVVWFEMDR